MKAVSKYVWLLSLPFLAATLFLPVKRDAWLDGPFDVSGMEAAFWIPITSIASVRAFFAVRDVSFLPDTLLTAVWGLFLLALLITPVLIFSRLRERRSPIFFVVSAVVATVLVGTWFSPLLWERGDPQPFHYSGYRVLAFAIAFTVTALIVRSIRPNHTVQPTAGRFAASGG